MGPRNAESGKRWVWAVAFFLLVTAIGFGVRRLTTSHGGGDWSLFGVSADSSRDPNVLLITLDTTRADHLGCYGRKEAETPTLDALAQSGVRFERAFCQVPLTLPSHTSLLTGLYPVTTGVRINGAAGIAPDVPTMAKMFKGHGYRTGAFVAAHVLDSAYGLASGFDLYDDNLGDPTEVAGDQDPVERSAKHVANAALSWLREPSESPFFAWVHFFDPHSPYKPIEEFADRFADPYDGEIAFVDAWITRLLDWLEETGLRDETLIIVAGDHGEGFHEHDEAEHGFFVYGSTMRVPLIFSFPGRLTTPQTVPAPVALVDVFPTVVDLLGWKAPPGLEGRSLAEACRTGGMPPMSVYGECEYPRLSFGWAGLRSLTTDRWKYIDAPRAELYDLRDDPGELNNILDTRKDIADKMRAALLDQVSRMSADRYEARRATLDAAAIAKLAALGYVAAPSSVADETENTVLRDPKDMHPVFSAFTRALGMMKHDDFENAARILRRLSTESPESAEIHSVLGSAYLRLERYAEAQAAFEKRLEMAGPSPRPLCGLADALQHQNRLQEAVVFYQQTIQLSADWEPAHRELGTILSKMKQFPDAERHWRRCVELRPDHAHYLTNLGTVLLAQRRSLEAIPFLEAALLDEPANEFAHGSLWQCYRAVGRRDDAIGALRAAKMALPRPSPIQCSLAWMLATTPAPSVEDVENAVRWAQECCEMLPGNVRHFDALAAAYAAHGEFEKAAEVARQAAAMAGKAGQLGLQGRIDARLRLYLAGRPFVEGPALKP